MSGVQRSNTPSSAALRLSAYALRVRLLGDAAGLASDERQASFLPILAITDGRSVPPRSRGGAVSPGTSSMDRLPMMRAVVRVGTNPAKLQCDRSMGWLQLSAAVDGL